MKSNRYIACISMLLISSCTATESLQRGSISILTNSSEGNKAAGQIEPQSVSSRYVYMWISNEYRAASGPNGNNKLIAIKN